MPVTPISLEIEDVEFISVLRVLQNLPGVARINFDLDSLNKKHGGRRFSKRNHANGAAPEQLLLPPPQKATRRKRGDGITSKDVILAILKKNERATRLVLRDALIEKGFSGGAVDGALARMKTAGEAKSIGEGVVQITAKGRKVPDPEQPPST